MQTLIAYDLGTGGVKTSLFDAEGRSLASAFEPYDTLYPRPGFREQRPEDWWRAIVRSTRAALARAPGGGADVAALAVSGHSLGVVPVDAEGRLLADSTPIWSDARAGAQAAAFFRRTDEAAWYLETGAGFPPPLYSLFKIMWFRDNAPALYARAAVFLGTKDYVNLRMTGVRLTDRSYASGCGAWSLAGERYREDWIDAAGLDPAKFPRVVPSSAVVGELLPGPARELGLRPGVKVCAGGVDNACMALGAACLGEGEAYVSLGTSAWVAVAGPRPVVEATARPYVFAHCVPGMYVSATAIFSAGNSLRWVRDTLCQDLVAAERAGGPDAYRAMDALAAQSPAGANRLLFNPSLAGGSALEPSPNLRGAFLGLDLRHTRADLLRATLEGVCLNLRLALDVLARQTPLGDAMLLVGGGGKSPLWRRIFASVFEKDIVETNVGQDAGSLGAAALAAVGAGLWRDFAPLRALHRTRAVAHPDPDDAALYRRLLPLFAQSARAQAVLGDALAAL